MTGNYPVPFISNVVPSLKAAKQYPEVSLFLECARILQFQLDFIFFHYQSRDQFSVLGYRADKHVVPTASWIRRLRRHDYGLMHLHLSSHDDISFAACLISGNLRNKKFNAYISGLSDLERRKIISDIDIKFEQLPSEITTKHAILILDNFKKPFYIERFVQNMLSMPLFARSFKDRLMRRSFEHLNNPDLGRLDSLSKEDVALVGMVLITEYWIKYEKLLQQLLRFLSQTDKPELLYNAKLLFAVILPDQFWRQLKTPLDGILYHKERELLAKINQKTEFVNFLAGLLSQFKQDKIRVKLQSTIISTVLWTRIRVDPSLFREVKYIGSLNPAELKLRSQVVAFASRFSQKLSPKQQVLDPEDQIAYEAKQEYISELVNLMIAANQKQPPLNVSRTEHESYLKEVNNFLAQDEFKVDQMVINPFLESNLTSRFIVAKVLPQVTIAKRIADSLLLAVVRYANPYLDDFFAIMNLAKKEQAKRINEASQKNLTEYIRRSIEILPKVDYTILSPRQLDKEVHIISDAKVHLGMRVFDFDGVEASKYKTKIGYNSLLLPDFNDIPDLAVDTTSVRSMYSFFVSNNVQNLLNKFTNSNLSFVREGLVNSFDYFRHYLAENSVFIGYEQLANLFTYYRKWRPEGLKDFGYRKATSVNYDYYDCLLDAKSWSNADSSAQAGQRSLIKDKTIQQYTNQLFAKWQNQIDNLIDFRLRKESTVWVANLFQNILAHKVYNVFSNSAYRLLPDNNWQVNLQAKIQYHFTNYFRSFKTIPKVILVQLFENQSYLAFFCRNISVEIKEQPVPVSFYVSNNETSLTKIGNSKWADFVAKLESDDPQLVSDLRYTWRKLYDYQVIYMDLVRAFALLFMVDLASRYITPKHRKLDRYQILKSVSDQERLVIHGGRLDDCRLILKQLKNNTITHNEILDRFYHFNKTTAEKERLTSVLVELNQQLSLIPYIKYAPRKFKIFRLKVGEIADILSRKIAELNEQHLKKITVLAYETWQIYKQIVEDEASYPYKYRYLTIAFNNVYIKVNQLYKREFIDFLQATVESQSGRKTARGFLLMRLYEAILFKDVLAQKKQFFIIGDKIKQSDLIYVLESTKVLRGLDSELYVDARLIADSKMKDDVLYYISPSNIIDFS